MSENVEMMILVAVGCVDPKMTPKLDKQKAALALLEETVQVLRQRVAEQEG